MTGDVKVNVPHGTISGYTRYGCRQPCCVEPHREYRRRKAAEAYVKVKQAKVRSAKA